jgi:hypothetical protein
MTDKRAAFIDGLRQIAAFLEGNLNMPLPSARIAVYADTKEEFLLAAIQLSHGGKVLKTADNPNAAWPRYHATRKFGDIEIDVQIDRKLVCRLVSPAVYDCPDSLLEAAAEYTDPEAAQ